MGKYTLKYSINCYALRQRWRYVVLCYKSLTYNIFDSTAESAFEPLFYVVDFAVRWFGRVFVAAVTALVTSVVVIFYMCVLPNVLEVHSPFRAYLHLFYGHYLLLMITFHYYKAVSTSPGKPPSIVVGVPVSCICKKCFLPKPPRTHHCNVCKACRLKMDHHCPWLNNCIGHFNHRYFICFCIFMCLGTIYVSLSSWYLFKDCFHAVEKYEIAKASLANFFRKDTTVPKQDRSFDPSIHICADKSRNFNNGVVYLWILCSAVTVALGSLTLWHAFLISRGETSIEKLINAKERRRLRRSNKTFTNPYHSGVIENWKQLLGFHNPRTFFWRVVIPSTHLPFGDGVVWRYNKKKSAFVA